MPRTNEQFQQMKDERKESILNVSLPLFSLYGKKVSIDLICEKAKCSHGLVYHYFKNTDAVYLELLKNEKYVSFANELFKDYSSIKAIDALKNIIGILYNVNDVTSMAYLNIIISSQERNSLFDLMKKLVIRGQKENDVTGGNPDDIVNAIFLLFKGIYLSYLTQKKPNIKKPSIEVIYEIFRKIVY